MNARVIMTTLFSVILLITVSAQKESKKMTITGHITDNNSRPVANAIIMIDNNNVGVMSDANGFYKVKVKRTAVTIGVVSLGGGVREENIEGRTEINFEMGGKPLQQQAGEVPPPSPGDEAVDIGYGSIKRKQVTSQVSKIDATDKKYSTYRNIYEMIERSVAGVKCGPNGIIIHDSKNLSGSIPALLVVDGVYVEDISSIQPITVKSIEVLKGSSASMYGSRGFGGVVLITTKKGNE